jgi:hypothetical protein
MQVDLFDQSGIEQIESGECKAQKARETQSDTATTQQLEVARLVLRRIARTVSQRIGSRWVRETGECSASSVLKFRLHSDSAQRINSITILAAA